MKAHSVFQQIFMGQSIFHNVVFALIYIFFFDYMWENFESVVFSYEGIIYNGDVERRIIGYIVALIPVLFYRGLRQISSWVALLITLGICHVLWDCVWICQVVPITM